MKLKDLLIKTTELPSKIKNEYICHNPETGHDEIDFSKVSEPIEDIKNYTVVLDVSILSGKLKATMMSGIEIMYVGICNFQNHKEIIDIITKKYLNVYKMIDNYYNSLSDEEKLKLELEE